jgi:two-component system sensor histidine kinase BaeS
VIGRECGTHPKVQTQVNLLERETKRLTRLMNDLLEFARPRELLPVRTDSRELLQEAVETYRAEHPGASPEIVVEDSSNLPPIHVDRTRLVQIIVNLIANAATHAQGVTKVTLSVAVESDGQVCLRVHDDGAGIPPEILPRISSRSSPPAKDRAWDWLSPDGSSQNTAAGSTWNRSPVAAPPSRFVCPRNTWKTQKGGNDG